MQRSSFTACAFILASLLFTCARAQELPFSVGADIRLTTSSQVFPTPFSIDPFQRNATDDLGSFASAAVHARHGIIDLLQVQLSFSALLKLTFFLNLPTDLTDHTRGDQQQRLRNTRKSERETTTQYSHHITSPACPSPSEALHASG